jgi:organic radical activating enzyme
VPPGVDWVCVSPKAGAELVVHEGDELKLVHPQPGAPPERYEALAFGRFSVQPMDGPDVVANTEACVRWCLEHPRWHLSLQTHKALGIR